MLIEFWNNGTLWDKVVLIYSAIVAFLMVYYICKYLSSNAKKKLNFIVKAQEEDCTIPCKLTCLTKEGSGTDIFYKAEYLYFVDGKRYFVTYRMEPIIKVDTSKDEFNADMMVENIKTNMLLFYNKKNPKKVMCKAEVFVSDTAMVQVRTPKNNAYRDVNKVWDKAIDMSSK